MITSLFDRFPTFMIGWATMKFHIYVDISIGSGNTMVWKSGYHDFQSLLWKYLLYAV